MALTGYRNLSWLKSRLLPAEMADETDYDMEIGQIGLSVAAAFDRFTGRVLRRTVDAVFETAANMECIVVSCYPMEGAPVVSLLTDGMTQDISQSVLGIQWRAGILWFYGSAGSPWDVLRVTATGGYWCVDEDLTPADTLPAGATALPDDILQAWVQQCRAICEAENLFRSRGAEKKKVEAGVTLSNLTLLQGVKNALQPHIRIG